MSKINKIDLSQILKPQKLIDVIGQNHLIGKDKLLTNMVKTNTMFSLIFFGPPGTGKSSLAKVICLELDLEFYVFNCSYQNKQELIQLLNLIRMNQYKNVLILEEIHRMNIDKQDIFLDDLENKNLLIIATTTENPYFVINPALRSRAQLVEIKPIEPEEFKKFIKKLINKKVLLTKLKEDQINFLSQVVSGDFRFLINVINKLNLLYPQNISNENLGIIANKTNINLTYDNDEWHNLKSALQKSIRGSDPDATVYYLAKLMVCGDLKTITRRLVICAFEDIGLANMDLCNRVIHACEFANKVGFPECYNILGPIVIEMALSPKSNSGQSALANALNFVNQHPNLPIPKKIQDAHYKSAVKLGVKGYVFPHDFAYSYVNQQYLPDEIKNQKFYFFNKYNIKEINWLKYWQKVKDWTTENQSNKNSVELSDKKTN